LVGDVQGRELDARHFLPEKPEETIEALADFFLM
jgi:hypothetical protein